MSDPSDASTGTKKRWLGWLIGVIAVPPLLAAVTSTASEDRVQDDLTTRTESALADAGYRNAAVRYSGRDATVTAPAASEADTAKIRDVVRGVEGNRVVQVKTGDAQPGPAARPFSVLSQNGDVTVTAVVPDEASKEAFLRAVQEKAGRDVGGTITVEPGAEAPDATMVGALAAALGTDPGSRTVSVEGVTVTITGTVSSDEEKTRITKAAADAHGAPASVTNTLTVDSGADQAAADRAAQAEIARVLAASTVNFQPNSAALTPQGTTAVQRVAAVLAKYPTVRTEVRGHVANTGNPAADARLSLARANAVIATLRRSGINAQRVVAKGLGSSKPLTTNPAQASRNRRVEFAILGGTK
jgi:outer membrane protein OmpA-like peptidoglycan-associated protein